MTNPDGHASDDQTTDGDEDQREDDWARPLFSSPLVHSEPLKFEAEPDWDDYPAEIPSTDVAAILKVHRKTLTKYVQLGKLRPPVAKGDNWSRYAKDDVKGFWRKRQIRIAQGYIPAPSSKGKGPVDDWVDDMPMPARLHGLSAVEPGGGSTADGDESGDGSGGEPDLTPALIGGALPERRTAGPIPGGGVETFPEPAAPMDLRSLSREGFQALLVAVMQEAQAPLLRQIQAADAQITELTRSQGELIKTQGDLVAAQERFLEAQAASQRQQAELQRQQLEAWRQMAEGQRATQLELRAAQQESKIAQQEQKRLADQVAHLTKSQQELTAQLQNQADREAEERRQSEAEPQNAWERFKRGLGLGGGQKRGN